MKESIRQVMAMEMMDSRGNPTVFARVETEGGQVGTALVPSGASTGAFEACELRDGDKDRYDGKGVQKAVDHVNNIMAPALMGKSVTDQRGIDDLLCRLDGTANKEKLGANGILSVSMACARAGAKAAGLPLYRYLGGSNAHVLPVPMMNVINGGKHAANSITFQEFMMMPVGAESFSMGLRWCSEVYHALQKLLKEEGYSTGVGDEGGFAPDFSQDHQGVEYIIRGVERAGYRMGRDFVIALDPATTELYDAATKEGHPGNYSLWKKKELMTPGELVDLWKSWRDRYPIFSIEDPLAEEDWQHHQQLTAAIGESTQLVGDDLFVTNVHRLEKGIAQKACNAILIKLNQIGTLTEGMDAVELARRHGYRSIISHRSGETEDSFIADLAVAMGCGQIKTGAPCRGERTAKYNRLLYIEQQLGSHSCYGGGMLK